MSQEQITKTIIVKAPVERAFQAWEDFDNFPHFMKYIKNVQKTGTRSSHWIMEGPLGKELEWDAKMTLHEPHSRIGWSSTSGDVKTSGQVTFAQLGMGETQVTVLMQYIPPAGLVGKVIGKVFSNPEARVEEDLKNFKAFIEGMHDRTAMGSGDK